jgi:hypothetical protein
MAFIRTQKRGNKINKDVLTKVLDYLTEEKIKKNRNFPLMHKIFQGNAVDVTTLCSTAHDIKQIII